MNPTTFGGVPATGVALGAATGRLVRTITPHQLAVTNADGQYAVGPGFLSYASGL